MIATLALLAGALTWLGYWCLVSLTAVGLWWLVLTLADLVPRRETDDA